LCRVKWDCDMPCEGSSARDRRGNLSIVDHNGGKGRAASCPQGAYATRFAVSAVTDSPRFRRSTGNAGLRIGIIGAGHIGGTLTRRLSGLGHEVRVANSRDPATLHDLARETPATACWAAEAAVGCDLLIISIQQGRVGELNAGVVAGRRPGAPIIDTNNYYPGRDGYIAAIEEGAPESVWVSEQLGSPVTKAFNCIWWKRLLKAGLPKDTLHRIAIPIAGDDTAHKQIVSRLVDDLGFDPIDAGPLSESWRMHPGMPVYGQQLDVDRTRSALATASQERPVQFRFDPNRGARP
jgi:predicted dinucleotide-binding enzyme